jgi:hypothetical protein
MSNCEWMFRVLKAINENQSVSSSVILAKQLINLIALVLWGKKSYSFNSDANKDSCPRYNILTNQTNTIIYSSSLLSSVPIICTLFEEHK